MKVKEMAKSVCEAVSKKAPELLIASGVVGLLTTVVLAVKATPKAEKHIEEKKKELNKEKLTVKETVQACGKDYIPAVASGVLSTAAVITGTVVGEKRAAGLLTMYTISEKALDEYKDIVIDTVSKKTKDEIDSKVAEKHVNEDISSGKQMYIMPATGGVWFRDSATGQTFVSDIPSVRAAIAKVNETIAYQNYASLNDLLYEYKQLDDRIGLTDLGDTVEWRCKISYSLVAVTLPEDRGVAMEIQYYKNPRTSSSCGYGDLDE